MWFAGGGGALRKLCRATAVLENEMSGNSMFVRYMSRERAVNVRKINPKVPIQEAYVISNSLYDVFKKHGPLSVPNTWLRAQVFKFSSFPQIDRKLQQSCDFDFRFLSFS